MQQTTNYNMNKPEANDMFSLDHWNQNTDEIDSTLAPEFEDYTGETEVPDESTALAGIKSKTKLGTLMQNIKAFCKGCCTLGMLVDNCVTDNANLPLAASQGKSLMDQITQLNSNLTSLTTRISMNAVVSTITTGASTKLIIEMVNGASGMIFGRDTANNIIHAIFTADNYLNLGNVGMYTISDSVLTCEFGIYANLFIIYQNNYINNIRIE